MYFLTQFWKILSFSSTLFQALRNLFLARSHIFQAESITEDQETPILFEAEQFNNTCDSAIEYANATLNLGKFVLFSYAALDMMHNTPTDYNIEEPIPNISSIFFRYVCPISTAVAIAQTAYQTSSYLAAHKSQSF